VLTLRSSTSHLLRTSLQIDIELKWSVKYFIWCNRWWNHTDIQSRHRFVWHSFWFVVLVSSILVHANKGPSNLKTAGSVWGEISNSKHIRGTVYRDLETCWCHFNTIKWPLLLNINLQKLRSVWIYMKKLTKEICSNNW